MLSCEALQINNGKKYLICQNQKKKKKVQIINMRTEGSTQTAAIVPDDQKESYYFI